MIRSLTKLCALLAIVSPAMGQTITIPVDMPWSSSLFLSATIDPLRTTTTGWSAVPKKTQTVNLSATSTSASGQFPSQTTAWTVNGVRLTLCAAGTFVCEQPMKIRQEKDAAGLPIAFQVPPGKALNFQLASGLQRGSLTLSLDPLVSAGPVTPPPVVVAPPPTPVTAGLSVSPNPLTGSVAQNAPCILSFTTANGSSTQVLVTWADQINQLLDLVPKAHMAPVAIPANGSTAFTLTCDSKTKGTFGGTATITSGATVLSLPISWTVN